MVTFLCWLLFLSLGGSPQCSKSTENRQTTVRGEVSWVLGEKGEGLSKQQQQLTQSHRNSMMISRGKWEGGVQTEEATEFGMMGG